MNEFNSNKMQEYNTGTPLTSDVYFLIQRFLSAGALTETLQVLNKELEKNKILPKRIDWLGNNHERTVEDMERQYPNIRPDFLYFLCSQATLLQNPHVTSFLSFRPKTSNDKNYTYNFNQLYNYITRVHGVPIHGLEKPFNLVNSIRGREISGPFSRQRALIPNFYSNIKVQRITLGHLSAVYCLLFDHSGQYVITGADDLLIKLWSTYTGRLIASFRGASSEITDIAINPENTLLAAGSLDRILRVWSLQSGAPVAVLTGHTGMITSVNFCPTSCWSLRCLISTSTDGSVAFWTYNYDTGGKSEFRSAPVLYQEKIRPGQAQMICSSFSPGGTFLATGSADHNVRVYYMKGDDGPQRILETEAHRDRVDSIQWAHSGLKFMSGSKDGTAIIWWFETQQWKNLHLDMTTKLPGEEPSRETKLKVTMVAWDRSDNWVVTAVSDSSLKVWTASNGTLVKVLTGHTDEVYVLEPHPHSNNVMLSAGHDGQLFVWDIKMGTVICRYLNSIEGQGHGAIFDVKWSPDGCIIAASDSHGNILTFGFGDGSPFYEWLPKELFFHTDYRPLVRDQNYWVLDEQTQVPPHLMPPPFLVDVDGNPYPPMLQRLVPGRENCNVEQLVPNIVIGNEGTQEVIQDIPPRILEDIEEEDFRANAGPSSRLTQRSRDTERIRQSTGEWQKDPSMVWKKRILVQYLNLSVLKRAQEIRENTRDVEMEEYQKQLRQRPHMICTSNSKSNLLRNKERKKKKSTAKSGQSTSRGTTFETVSVDELFKDDEENSGDCSGYSDWAADEVMEPRKRSRRRRRKPSSVNSSDDDDDDEDVDDDVSDTEDSEVDVEDEKNDRKAPARTSKEGNAGSSKAAKTTAQVPSTSTDPAASTVPEQYKLSEWLSETRPRKSPYYPQMGDEIVYFIQGHQLYLDAVQAKNVYEISTKDLPWNKVSLRDYEFVKVLDINYEIKPPRLSCLKLALLDEEGRLTGKVFTVKYHDMNGVLDFFVLKQSYMTALSRDWEIENKFRCMIDDNWWVGTITNKTPASEQYPNSTFMCYEICWSNGTSERMSPWDMEPIDEERLPQDEELPIPVTDEELTAILYKPTEYDWPNCQRDTVCQNITRGITQVMELAIAEPFLVPVDINVYPTYAMIVEYPIDLSTIKARFENNFYRRLTAAQFDIRYLGINAEKFNERHSDIVKHARILTELCLRIVKAGNNHIDVAALYHQLVDTYDSSNTDEEIEISPSTSNRTLRTLPNSRSWKSPDDWKQEARNLLNAMWDSEDSEPFRTPVNLQKYPTYHSIIKDPMDLSTVKKNLQIDKYQVPQEFCLDMKLIFQNSRTFNTNKRSRIYVMTVRLAAMFDEHMKKILSNWRLAKRRSNRRGQSDGEDSEESLSSSKSIKVTNEETQDENSILTAPDDNTDNDSDNTPLGMLRDLHTNTNTETEEEATGNNLDVMNEETREIVKRNRKASESEESYRPDNENKYVTTRGKRRKRSSSLDEDDEEEEEEMSGSDSSTSTDGEFSNKRRRPKRKNGRRSKRQTRTRRKKTNRTNKESEDMSDTEEENDDNSASSVSNSSSYTSRTRRQSTNNKRRRIINPPATDEENDTEENQEELSEENSNASGSRGERSGRYFGASVSSRGRVRKFTERAAALLKKDRKLR